MRNCIVGGFIFAAITVAVEISNISFKRKMLRLYAYMLQDNPPYILATATATVVQLRTLA